MPEPLVQGRPGQVGAVRRLGLVTAGLQVGGEHAGQRGAMVGVVGEQRADLTLGESLQPGIIVQ